MDFSDLAARAANGIDKVHTFLIFPGIIGLFVYAVFANKRRNKGVATSMCLTILAAQLALQDCPISMLVQWLDHFKYPQIYQDGGVSWTYLYMHYLLPYPNLHWVYSVISMLLAIVAFVVAFLPTKPAVPAQEPEQVSDLAQGHEKSEWVQELLPLEV